MLSESLQAYTQSAVQNVNHTNHVDELDRALPTLFRHELYNRAGDVNRVRTLISILFYVIYFNLFVECFGCLRFFSNRLAKPAN